MNINQFPCPQSHSHGPLGIGRAPWVQPKQTKWDSCRPKKHGISWEKYIGKYGSWILLSRKYSWIVVIPNILDSKKNMLKPIQSTAVGTLILCVSFSVLSSVDRESVHSMLPSRSQDSDAPWPSVCWCIVTHLTIHLWSFMNMWVGFIAHCKLVYNDQTHLTIVTHLTTGINKPHICATCITPWTIKHIPVVGFGTRN